jgi:hypothetical protein
VLDRNAEARYLELLDNYQRSTGPRAGRSIVVLKITNGTEVEAVVRHVIHSFCAHFCLLKRGLSMALAVVFLPTARP